MSTRRAVIVLGLLVAGLLTTIVLLRRPVLSATATPTLLWAAMSHEGEVTLYLRAPTLHCPDGDGPEDARHFCYWADQPWQTLAPPGLFRDLPGPHTAVRYRLVPDTPAAVDRAGEAQERELTLLRLQFGGSLEPAMKALEISEMDSAFVITLTAQGRALGQLPLGWFRTLRSVVYTRHERRAW
ncbi:MAG: hypothetical protein HOP28_12980 [Gemmatimonadales bacterium]|nr:hypothetical protein [Gemmatimonadales bacterium]